MKHLTSNLVETPLLVWGEHRHLRWRLAPHHDKQQPFLRSQRRQQTQAYAHLGALRRNGRVTSGVHTTSHPEQDDSEFRSARAVTCDRRARTSEGFRPVGSRSYHKIAIYLPCLNSDTLITASSTSTCARTVAWEIVWSSTTLHALLTHQPQDNAVEASLAFLVPH